MKIFSNSTMTPPDKNKTATPSHRTDSTLLPPSTIHNRVAVKHSKVFFGRPKIAHPQTNHFISEAEIVSLNG